MTSQTNDHGITSLPTGCALESAGGTHPWPQAKIDPVPVYPQDKYTDYHRSELSKQAYKENWAPCTTTKMDIWNSVLTYL